MNGHACSLEILEQFEIRFLAHVYKAVLIREIDGANNVHLSEEFIGVFLASSLEKWERIQLSYKFLVSLAKMFN